MGEHRTRRPRLLCFVSRITKKEKDVTFLEPGEQNNLANLPEFSRIQRDLSHKTDTWMVETNDHGIQSEIEILKRYSNDE
jgi:hypothetical protein